jgi:DNA polymerase (family 10)
MARKNEAVATLLESIAKLLALKGENPFRIRAYEEAARAITATSEDVEALHRAGRLTELHGVGESIAAKIAEFLDTGRSTYYEQLKAQVPEAAAELLEVPSIGPARAQLLTERLGITTIADLQLAAREHRLCTLPGFGEKLEQRIAREAARVAQRTKRMLLGVALPAAEEVVGLLQGHAAVLQAHPAGSIRRMKETIGDIDVLVASEQPAAVADAFTTLPVVQEVLAKGPTRCSILTKDHLQIDLRVMAPNVYGAALQYFTGSKEHNIALRSIAIERRWKLSEYGLFDASGRRIAGETEEEIYRALDMDWMPPELRENRGEIEAAQRHRIPRLVTLEDIQGDLHVHTDWSDGHDPPHRMVEGAIARGYHYLALTDHSQSLGVARGLSPDDVRRQRRLVDELNERYAPFRVLHGTEVNIRTDGTLDYPDDVLAEFDLVTAAVHSAFSQSRQRMTDRIIRALRHPLVHALSHPTGRRLLRRPEYEVELDAVLKVAAEEGVALEVNGQPDRLDLDDVWTRRAIEAGVMLVCDSDAHSALHLDYMRYSVATARRGWAEPRHVLNTLPLSRLLAHLNRRRRRPRAA